MINTLEWNKDKLSRSYNDLDGERLVGWFSHGIASCCAIKIAIDHNFKQEAPLPFVVATIYLEEEHKDNIRFEKQAYAWMKENVPKHHMHLLSFETLKNQKYNGSVDNVVNQAKYMSGVYGAMCTKVLKKEVRYKWQLSTDIHIFGMTVEESQRIDNLLDGEPELMVWSPLIDADLTKQDCFTLFEPTGIEVPMMYRLGFHNNNCIGCLKASGAGYWNHVRKLFPDVFNRRAEQERLLNVALCKITLNVLFRLYANDMLHFLKQKLEGEYLEFKIDGKDKPVLGDKGKPKDCILIPEEYYTLFNHKKSHLRLGAGEIKGCKYSGWLVNTYEAFNDNTSAMALITSDLVDGQLKQLKVFGSSIRVPLRYLPKDAGDQKSMYVGDCGFFCEKLDTDN